MPVVATSGNLQRRADRAPTSDEARARLGGIADQFLVHDRPIERHVDDSVGRIMRRSSADAPGAWLRSAARAAGARRLPALLAVGAHLKSAVALSVGRQVFVSQHIGDLETPGARAGIRAGDRATSCGCTMPRPVAIAHDLHPDYTSTRPGGRAPRRRDGATVRAPPPARSSRCSTIMRILPHAWPSMASGERRWASSGTGPASARTERCGAASSCSGTRRATSRVAHLRPFRLPGGDAAAREPRRVGAGAALETLGERGLDRERPAPVRTFSRAERERARPHARDADVNAPWTTSAGRLFDGLAAPASACTRSVARLRGTGCDRMASADRDRAATDGRARIPLPLTARPAGGAGRAARTRLAAAASPPCSRTSRGAAPRATSRRASTTRSWRDRRRGARSGRGARGPDAAGASRTACSSRRRTRRLRRRGLRGAPAPPGAAERRRHRPGADRGRRGTPGVRAARADLVGRRVMGYARLARRHAHRRSTPRERGSEHVPRRPGTGRADRARMRSA